MKKIMTFLAVSFALSLTSCTNVYERAYALETNYQYVKSISDSTAVLEYGNKFMDLWLSMTDHERERYKSYRKRMSKESERELKQLRSIESEGRALLNE